MKSMDWARKSWQRKAGASPARLPQRTPRSRRIWPWLWSWNADGAKIFNYRLDMKYHSSSGRHHRRRRLSHTANLERLECGGGPLDVHPWNPTLGFRSGKRTA